MTKFVSPRQEIYCESLRREFIQEFRYLQNVIAGRNDYREDFIDKLLGVVTSIVEFAPKGAEILKFGDKVVSIATELADITDNIKGPATTINGIRKERKIVNIGKIADRITDAQLEILIDEVAREAVRRYAYLINIILDDDSIIEFAKVGAHRILDYLGTARCTLTVDNLLMGLLKGESGAYIKSWKNNALASKDKQHKQKITAEGGYQRCGWVTQNGNTYTFYAPDSATRVKEDSSWKYPWRKIIPNRGDELKYGYAQVPESFIQNCFPEHKPITDKEEPEVWIQQQYQSYVVQSQEIIEYLLEIKHKKTTFSKDISFNEYILQTRFKDRGLPTNHCKVVFRGALSFDEQDPHHRELADANGKYLDIRDGNFAGVDFTGCKLKRCMISQCEGANFTGAEFVEVIAEDANFKNAILDNLIAQNCNFKQASCRHAKLRFAQIKDSNFQLRDILGLDPLKTNFDNSPTHPNNNDLLEKINQELDMQQQTLDDSQTKLQKIHHYLACIQELQEKISQGTNDLQAGQYHADGKLNKLQDHSDYQKQQLQQMKQAITAIEKIIHQHQENAISNHQDIVSLIDPINSTIQLLNEQHSAEQIQTLSDILDQINKIHADYEKKQDEVRRNQIEAMKRQAEAGTRQQENAQLFLKELDKISRDIKKQHKETRQCVKKENKTTRQNFEQKFNELKVVEKPKLLPETPENIAKSIIDLIQNPDKIEDKYKRENRITQYARQLTSYVTEVGENKLDQQMGCKTLNNLIKATFSDEVNWLDKLVHKRILLELSLTYLDQALIDDWPIEFDPSIIQRPDMKNVNKPTPEQLADQWAIEYCCDAIKENVKLLQKHKEVIKEGVLILNKAIIGVAKFELWELKGIQKLLEICSHTRTITTLGCRYLSRHAIKEPTTFLFLQTFIQAQCTKTNSPWQIDYAAQQALGYVALNSPYTNLVTAAMQGKVFGLTHFIEQCKQKKSNYHEIQWGIGLFEVICKLANTKTSSNASNKWGRFYYQIINDLCITHRIDKNLIAYLHKQDINGSVLLAGQYECPYKLPDDEKSLDCEVKQCEHFKPLEEASTALQIVLKTYHLTNIGIHFTQWIEQIPDAKTNKDKQLAHAKIIITTGAQFSQRIQNEEKLKEKWEHFRDKKLCSTIKEGLLLTECFLSKDIIQAKITFESMKIKLVADGWVSDTYLNYLFDQGRGLLSYFLSIEAYEDVDYIIKNLYEIISTFEPIHQCKRLRDLGDIYLEQDRPGIAHAYYIKALEIQQDNDEKTPDLDFQSPLNRLCLNAFYQEIIHEIPWQLQNKENLNQLLNYFERIDLYRKSLSQLDEEKLLIQSQSLGSALEQLVYEIEKDLKDKNKQFNIEKIQNLLKYWSNHEHFLQITQNYYQTLIDPDDPYSATQQALRKELSEVVTRALIDLRGASDDSRRRWLKNRLSYEQPTLIDFNLHHKAQTIQKSFKEALSNSERGDHQAIVSAYQTYQTGMLDIIEEAVAYVVQFLGNGDYEKRILLFMPTGAHFQVYPQQDWRFALLCQGTGNPESLAGFVRTVALVVNILTGETIDTTYQSEIPSPKENVMGTPQCLTDSIEEFLLQNKYREAIELAAARPCDGVLKDDLYMTFKNTVKESCLKRLSVDAKQTDPNLSEKEIDTLQNLQASRQSARELLDALDKKAYRFGPDPQHMWAPIIWLTNYCEALRRLDGAIESNSDPITLCQQEQKLGLLASAFAHTLTAAISELLRLTPLRRTSQAYQDHLNKLENFMFPTLQHSLAYCSNISRREFNPQSHWVEQLLVNIQQKASNRLKQLIPETYQPNQANQIVRAIHYLVALNHYFANEAVTLSCYKKLSQTNQATYCDALAQLDAPHAKKLAQTLASDGWSYAKDQQLKIWYDQLYADLIERAIDEKATDDPLLYSRSLKDPHDLNIQSYCLKPEVLKQLFYNGKQGQFRHKFILRLISGQPTQKQIDQAAVGEEILLIKANASFNVGFFDKNGQYQQKKLAKKQLIQLLRKKKFQNHVYDKDDLHPSIYELVASYQGKLPKGRHTVLFIKINGEVRYCLKLYPENAGAELMVSHLLRRLGIAQTVVPLHLVKIRHEIIDDNGLPKTITSAVLIMQHAAFDAQAKKLTEHMSFNKAWEMSIDPTSYTQHLLRVIFTNPEDDKGNDYIVLPIGNGKFRLVRIDNERVFFPMYKRVEYLLGTITKKELLIKSIIYLLAQIKQPLVPSVIKPLTDVLDINQLMQGWLDDVEKEHRYLRKLFSFQEVLQHYQVSFPEVVKQRHFFSRDQDPTCALIIGMFDGIEKTLFDYLALAQGVIDTAKLYHPDSGRYTLNLLHCEPQEIQDRRTIALYKKDDQYKAIVTNTLGVTKRFNINQLLNLNKQGIYFPWLDSRNKVNEMFLERERYIRESFVKWFESFPWLEQENNLNVTSAETQKFVKWMTSTCKHTAVGGILVSGVQLFYGIHPRLFEHYYPDIVTKLRGYRSATKTLCNENADNEAVRERPSRVMRQLYRTNDEKLESHHTGKDANQLCLRLEKNLNKYELHQIYEGKSLSVYQAQQHISVLSKKRLDVIRREILEGNPTAKSEFDRISMPHKLYIFEFVRVELIKNPNRWNSVAVKLFLKAIAGVKFSQLDLSAFREHVTKKLFEAIIKGAGSYLLDLNISGCEQLDGQSVLVVSRYCKELQRLLMHDNLNLIKIDEISVFSYQLAFPNLKTFEIDGCKNIRKLNSAIIPLPALNKSWWEKHAQDYPYLETINGVPREAVKEIARNMKRGRLEVNCNDFARSHWSNWVAFLAHTQGITQLDIKTKNLDNEDARTWAEIIEKNEFIEEIIIDGKGFEIAPHSPSVVIFPHSFLDGAGVAKIQLISVVLAKLPNLKELNLERSDIYSAGIATLAPAFAKLPNLKVLNLEGNDDIYSAEIAVFAPALAKLSHLEVLNLEWNGIGPWGIATLAPVLAKLSHLKVLNLEGNNIHPKGIATLAPVLAKLSHLEVLNLKLNFIGEDGIATLAPALAKLSHLKVLNLERNDIGPRKIATLAPALAKLSHLEVLNLKWNLIGEDGIATLAPVLAKLSHLKVLYLEGNDISLRGIATLAPVLAKLSHLKVLHLDANDIGDAGIATLAPVLAKLSHLEVLHLNGNGIGDAGIATLAPVLAKLSHLEVLSVGWNLIGEDGIATLAPVLAKLPNLKELNVEGNLIGEDGIATLAPVLAKLSHLKVLALDQAKLTDSSKNLFSPQSSCLAEDNHHRDELKITPDLDDTHENPESPLLNAPSMHLDHPEESGSKTLTDSKSHRTTELSSTERECNTAISLSEPTDSKLDTTHRETQQTKKDVLYQPTANSSLQTDVNNDEIKGTEHRQSNDIVSPGNFESKQVDDQVNIKAYYDEGMILKVIATHIEKVLQLHYYVGKTYPLEHFFKQEQGNTLVEICNSALLITANKTLYHRPFNGEQRSLSICFSVRFENQMGNACNQITQNFQTALEQIIAWQKEAIKNENLDQLITRHTIIFPYQQSTHHWNLGLANFELQELKVTSASIIAYDPFGGGKLSKTALLTLQALIRHHFDDDQLTLKNTEPKLNNKSYRKQQGDNYLCGGIVAENAKGAIDGDHSVFGKFYAEATNAHHNLRQQHIDEVNDPIFTQRQKDNCDLDPQGDKLSVKVFDAYECFQELFRKLDDNNRAGYDDLLNWLADVYQSTWYEQDEKQAEVQYQAQKTFMKTICELEEKYKDNNLAQNEQAFIAQFSQDNQYTPEVIEKIKADPEAGLRLYFKKLCSREQNADILNQLKICNHEGQQISFFHAFFKDKESGIFCNGGYELLKALAKEHRLATIRPQSSQTDEDDPYEELKARLITYPPFRVCLPEDPRMLIIRDRQLILVDVGDYHLSRFQEQLWNEFFIVKNEKHGLAKHLNEEKRQNGRDWLLEIKIDEVKVKDCKGCYRYVLPTKLLDLIIEAFKKEDLETISKQEDDEQAQVSQNCKGIPNCNHKDPNSHYGFFKRPVTAQSDQIGEDNEWEFIDKSELPDEFRSSY